MTNDDVIAAARAAEAALRPVVPGSTSPSRRPRTSAAGCWPSNTPRPSPKAATRATPGSACWPPPAGRSAEPALPNAAQHPARTALPERADFGEPGRAERARVDGQLRALAAVVNQAP
jgi:hypothetical protein